jgi:methionyl-tRNA synthetase
MDNVFYITTPIYYVNARPHLGHAYTTIIADVTRRFQTMLQKDTFFLTGLSPKAYVDQISDLFKNLWPQLSVNNDYFVRTTHTEHMLVVQQILQKIYDSGDIYFSEYEGLYCFGCERFLTDREIIDGLCPDHQVAPKPIKEANYFFKMSKYQEWLIDHIKSNPDFIRPERYRNEALAFLREPLEDLCISRPKTRLEWGITLPFDENFVTYVWFDALVNYVSAIGYPQGEKFNKYWPAAQHIVAKDILKPHGIYWPIMLKSAGIPIYQHLNVHGYWNIDQSKMSKSIGNVVEPLVLKDTYGIDAFRFFLLRDMVFGLDSNFSEQAMIDRINADLANDLGNLFSRVLAMTHKYFDGKVPQVDHAIEQELSLGLKSKASVAIVDFEREMECFAFHKGIMAIWEFISHMNKYVDVTAPWQLAKKAETRQQLQAVIYNLLEGLRVISGLIYPIMPDTAKAMQKHLGLDPDTPFYTINELTRWDVLQPDSPLPKGKTLFPRIDTKKGANVDAQEKPSSTPSKEKNKGTITFDDFKALDLRVAIITAAEAIPKAKKLLKLTVDCGEERTVVAGIAACYQPQELVGKQVILVANLKPAKLMGITSEGMLLAANDNDECVLVTLEKKVAPGSPVR